MPPEALAAPFLLLLLAAAASDLASMEIPNWISIALAASFAPAAFLAGLGWGAIGLHLGFGLFAFAVCAGLFHVGVIGGGDAKVLSAVALWTGWSALLPFLFWTSLAGGLLALGVLALRRLGGAVGPTAPRFLRLLLDKSRGVPYAVAIAVGGFGAFRDLPLLSV